MNIFPIERGFFLFSWGISFLSMLFYLSGVPIPLQNPSIPYYFLLVASILGLFRLAGLCHRIKRFEEPGPKTTFKLWWSALIPGFPMAYWVCSMLFENLHQSDLLFCLVVFVVGSMSKYDPEENSKPLSCPVQTDRFDAYYGLFILLLTLFSWVVIFFGM